MKRASCPSVVRLRHQKGKPVGQRQASTTESSQERDFSDISTQNFIKDLSLALLHT